MIRKTRIRIWIVVVIIGMMGFSDWSFAAENDKLTFLGFSLSWIFSVLQWIRVFFANLAGTFLTNKWVYGEILGLDALLWKFWNLMKNIANFGLGFYFLYKVFGGLITQGKEKVTKNLKNIILWLLIAGIGIQSSWFLTAALVDVSTIALVAAGSFPSQVISGSPYIEGKVENSINAIFDKEAGKEISLFSKDAKASNFIEVYDFPLDDAGNLKDKKYLVDSLMPNQENISGPLYFIGFSILDSDRSVSIDTSSIGRLKGSIFNILIQSGTTAIFSIEMIILCIVALMRIVYLWMFIVLSPIAILLWCIEKSGDKDFLAVGLVKSLGKHIKVKSFIINAFRPTFLVLGLGLSVIFVTLMNAVILDYTTVDIGGTVFTSSEIQSSIAEGEQTYTTAMDSNFFHIVSVGMGKTLLELVLSILTVIMVYYIIKFVMKIGEGDDFVSKRISGLYESFEKTVTSAPIVPFVGYDEKGVGKPTNISLKGLASIPEMAIAGVNETVNKTVSDQETEVAKMWGILKDTSLTPTEKNSIVSAGNVGTGWGKLEKMKTEINKIKTEDGKGMILNPGAPDQFWRSQFSGWLDERVEKDDYQSASNQWRHLIEDWKDLGEKDKNNRSLENLFGNTTHVKTYVQFFFDEGDSRHDINTWGELKDADISKQ